VAIYFEYAFLRDLWFNIDSQFIDNESRNAQKRNVILDLLKPTNREELKNMSVLEFNTYFGAVPKPSPFYIQSPGNWSIRSYAETIHKDELLNVSRFKWCFNAKPDVVIHTTKSHAICIEAKLESKEGVYPSNEHEKKIFTTNDLPLVGQLEIQKKIMVELLGIQTQFIFLVQHSPDSFNPEVLTWKEVFSNMDTTDCPSFINEWMRRLD